MSCSRSNSSWAITAVREGGRAAAQKYKIRAHCGSHGKTEMPQSLSRPISKSQIGPCHGHGTHCIVQCVITLFTYVLQPYYVYSRTRSAPTGRQFEKQNTTRGCSGMITKGPRQLFQARVAAFMNGALQLPSGGANPCACIHVMGDLCDVRCAPFAIHLHQFRVLLAFNLETTRMARARGPGHSQVWQYGNNIMVICQGQGISAPAVGY